jgi:lipid A disaccharide synthetase
VLGSRYVADYYDKKHQKVVCLGSPKFDVEINKNEVVKKYGLTHGKKRATVFYPRSRDAGISRLHDIVAAFHAKDYEVVFKTRGKDPYQSSHSQLTNQKFYDESWFPSTAMELISASDIIVNFSSTVIEETTVLKKPVLNYHIKPFNPTFDFLYNFDFVESLSDNFSMKDLEEKITCLEVKKILDFEEANNKLLDTKESSKEIIDYLL